MTLFEGLRAGASRSGKGAAISIFTFLGKWPIPVLSSFAVVRLGVLRFDRSCKGTWFALAAKALTVPINVQK